MNNELADLMSEEILNLLCDIDALPVLHDGQEWTEARKLYDYFGINSCNIGRTGKNYPDVFFQDPPKKGGTWFIQIEFIPWLVLKWSSNHTGKSLSDVVKRRTDFLNKIGIPVPKPNPYLYFTELKDRNIKIGHTADYLSGNRKQKLEKKFDIRKWLRVIPHMEASKFEVILLDYFRDLHVGNECCKPKKVLIDFGSCKK